jgi:hypothetical protein
LVAPVDPVVPYGEVLEPLESAVPMVLLGALPVSVDPDVLSWDVPWPTIPCEPEELPPAAVEGVVALPDGALSAVPDCPMGVPYGCVVDVVFCAELGVFACD